MTKNPIKQSENIKRDFSEYVRSTFDIRDNTYKALFYNELDAMEDSLYKGPYLCSTYPFEKGKTIDELIAEGEMSPSFKKLGGISQKTYKLYRHQVEAFERIESGENVVITTGTGSGKTECFVYPILDSIIKEIENGNTNPGIRAIFLFPMNALINDQIDRIRELLSCYPEIKFGFYTGETPEEGDLKARKDYELKYGKVLSSNELVTREQMRKEPPHILFTNYSMLEYLLIRPSDACLISTEALQYWKYVVLDEAHTYKGSLGMEISVLLRRLSGIVAKKPQFILTSATLGRGQADTDKIIEFAHSLTSSDFKKEDIILAKRHELTAASRYVVSPTDCIELTTKIINGESVIDIFEKYKNYDDSLSLENNLYELLFEDSNTFELFQLSKKGRSFFGCLESIEGLNNNVDALVSLIELISKATSSEGYKLFDVKYHMFIKAPDGAFITLGEEKALKLVSCQTINGRKAFKIGICQNCKTPYVMGIVENNILCIDDEVDIDEEYLEKQKKIGYYLIGNCLSNGEKDAIEEDKEHFKKCYVCPKCGHIRREGDLTSTKCDCEEVEEILYLYKEGTLIDDDENMAFSNNVKECAICGYKTNIGGVVMGFHIGKDRATALISQILYRSMNYPQIIDEAKSGGIFAKGPVYKNGVKQFIAFSDARQQAAFFNKFINANDDRFLKKAIIWKILNDPLNNGQPIKFSTLVTKIAEVFQNDLSYDPDEALKHSMSAALWELLNVDGRNSAEGLGLFGFVLDLPSEYDEIATIENYLSSNGFTNITAEDFKVLTRSVLSIFRTTPAIRYPQLTTNGSELDDLLGYRKFINYLELQTPKGQKLPPKYEKKVRSFLPIDPNSSNKIVNYVMKSFNLKLSDAKRLLEIVYTAAKSASVIVSNADGYDQIDSKMFSVHSYKEKQFYICKKCGKVTFYNLNGKCTEGDCDGTLEECDPETYFSTNYYRKEYITRPIERVISREHTAQIKSVEAKKIQQDFKDKKINIISCSTTFEMGIDLDKLDTVFMRNIPPSPANYVQRAGRAGRRADSSAFILTFCSTSSHDYTFFNDPTNMIAGMVEPPHFRTDNDKIIIRHIAASALGFYFRKYPEAFDSIDSFLSEKHIDKFFDFVDQRPTELGDYIDNFVLMPGYLYDTYGSFQWISYLESSSKGALKNMEIGITETIDTYQTAIDELNTNKPDRYWKLVGQYEEAIRKLKFKNSIIQYLARFSVIPRYGFPIDNVSLKIYDFQKDEFEEKYDLTRDLSIALSEYAPESEVIVDGKKYTSRYIYTPYPNAPQSISYYLECPHCHSINIFETESEGKTTTNCKYCNDLLNAQNRPLNSFIRPNRGFVAGLNKATRKLKPMRSYANEVMYTGRGLNPTITPIDINSVINVSEFKNEELLVLNSNPFYYCEKCGYTVLDRKNVTNTLVRPHNNHRGQVCDVEGNKLHLTALGHTYNTDVVKLSFTGVPSLFDYDTAISSVYALLEGFSIAFDIERNDIGGMITKTSETKPYQFILFDTVSGGAGHVKKLEDPENVIKAFNCALKKVSQDCCDEETSCYNCLKNFNNQRIHRHLKRGLARNAIQELLNKIRDNSINYLVKDVSLSLKNGFSSFSAKNYFDEETANYVIQLITIMSSDVCYYPQGYGITLMNSSGECLYADFYWKERDILLFTLENLDSYRILGEGKSKYECYLLDDNLDLTEFVKKIRKGN